MNAPRRIRYPTKAKIALAIDAARHAGIDPIGAIQIGPDGTIRISRADKAVADEFGTWFPDHADRS